MKLQHRDDRATGIVLPAGAIYTMAYDADDLRRRKIVGVDAVN